MEFDLNIFIFLSFSCFLAAFIDAIAGGGGVISLPAYMISGIPLHYALGSNKFAVTFGCLGSSLKYILLGKINLKILKYPIIISFIGGILGAKTATLIKEDILEYIVLILLIFTLIYTLLNKNLGLKNEFIKINKKINFLGTFWSFILAFYSGFFGPGSGGLMMLMFIKIYKYDFVTASANAKIISFISTFSGLLSFIYLGKINYLYSIPMGILMFLGGQLGAKYAISKGVKFIKVIFILISFLTIVGICINIFIK
ncbi:MULTISPECIES: TSUP family transporter [Fusobacterium]|uniref:sulfite exporter TauE/SafE family protein n=1 Tax=Fusobacterium TaxID=848 RepID=UPI0014776240|nr:MULTISPECIES: TSUP family transporter [Fusobacterium]NME36577.1 TSUP family transporter [Fusobacterium sp. FSA-380-WT-3A]